MPPPTLPDIGPTTDLTLARTLCKEYLDEVNREEARRSAMTPVQRLAERMNSLFSRQPGEVWYYEGDDWNAPEHQRWLKKAEKVMERFDDPDEAITFLRQVR